jgi:hypothetical protein
MLTLSDDELRELTGYTQPTRVLAELHLQGYYRARRSPTTGRVILERAHYDSVCQGRAKPADSPKLHTPSLRAA